MKFLSVKRCVKEYIKTKEKLSEYPIGCSFSESTQECTQDFMTVKLQSYAKKAKKTDYKFEACAERQFVSGSHTDNVNKDVFVPSTIFVIDMDKIFGRLNKNERVAMAIYAIEGRTEAIEYLDQGNNTTPETEFYRILNTLKDYLQEGDYVWTKEELKTLKKSCKN